SWDADSLVAGARGQVATLARNSATGNFTLQTSDGTTWVYNSTKLQTITYLGGYSQTLAFDTNGYNTGVTDNLGRSLAFTYAPNGLLQSMTVPGGQVYQYTYRPRVAALAHDGDPPDLWALEYVIEPAATVGGANNPRIQ